MTLWTAELLVLVRAITCGVTAQWEFYDDELDQFYLLTYCDAVNLIFLPRIAYLNL